MFKLSPFKLGVFRQCRRRYKYHYVDGLYGQYHKRWPHLTMGAHVHGALNAFFSRLNRDRSPARLRWLLQQRWGRYRDCFADRAEEQLYWSRALGQLRWLCATQDLTAQPIMLEAIHEVGLAPGFRLVGKVDRVDRDEDGALCIVDYKTNKSSGYADDFQLLAYALLLGRKFRAEVASASYLFLNGDGLHNLVPTSADLERAAELLHAARAEIQAERNYEPRPGPLCRWCDFQDLCAEARLDDLEYDLTDDAFEEP